MADQKQDDKGPYAVRGRPSEHGEEVTLGTSDTLDGARELADAQYSAGAWPIVNVVDRESRNVYRAGQEEEKQAAEEGEAPKRSHHGHK